MNYQVDVAEIVRFIGCGIDASSSKDATECVARFTEAAKDEIAYMQIIRKMSLKTLILMFLISTIR